jgi:hypothetical protein
LVSGKGRCRGAEKWKSGVAKGVAAPSLRIEVGKNNMGRSSGGYLLFEEFLFLLLVFELVYIDHLLAALLRSRHAVIACESQAAFANWNYSGGIAYS